MDPLNLQRTIYLGDRGVKAILIQGWGKTVKVQIDSISRVRSPDGRWHFYTDEDIDDGFLVFGEVEACAIEPPGSIPDGYVGSLTISPSDELSGKYVAELHTAGRTPEGPCREIVIRVIFGSFYLEDPKNPGVQITT